MKKSTIPLPPSGTRNSSKRKKYHVLIGISFIITVAVLFLILTNFLFAYHPPHATIRATQPQWLEYNPRIETMIAQVNESELYRTTSELQNFSTRKYPSPENNQASHYLYGRLVNMSGLHVEYQGAGVQNIIATIPGREESKDVTFIIGAHYDSISDDGNDAPGATDNGCGAAIVLELARVMNQHDFNHTIQFSFWNSEEIDHKGSREYVTYARENSLDIPLYYNVDSSCYDPDNQYVLDIMSDEQSKPIAELMTRYNSLYGINFNLTYNRHDCTGDQSSFRDGGYPVIMTHSQSHGPAHTPYDTIDKVSPGYAKKNAQLALSVLSALAEVQ